MLHNSMDTPTQRDRGVGQETLEQPSYLSFVLRLFRADDEERPAWRIWLQSSLTGQREGFVSLDDLLDFLQRQMGMTSDAAGEGGRRSS